MIKYPYMTLKIIEKQKTKFKGAEETPNQILKQQKTSSITF